MRPASLKGDGLHPDEFLHSHHYFLLDCLIFQISNFLSIMKKTEKNPVFQREDSVPWDFFRLSVFKADQSLQIFQGLPCALGLGC